MHNYPRQVEKYIIKAKSKMVPCSHFLKKIHVNTLTDLLSSLFLSYSFKTEPRTCTHTHTHIYTYTYIHIYISGAALYNCAMSITFNNTFLKN